MNKTSEYPTCPAQDQIEYAKKLFNLDKENSSSSNTTLLLSFQTAQNKQQKTTFHSFLSSFLRHLTPGVDDLPTTPGSYANQISSPQKTRLQCPSTWAMNKQVLNISPHIFTQAAPSSKRKPPSFKLFQSHYLSPPSCTHTETYFCRA